MLSKRSVTVGKCYVNERAGLIREVVEEIDRYRIKYNEYNLQTGQLIPAPFQVCHKSQMERWADREARDLEIARLHPQIADPWFTDLPQRQIKRAELELTKASMEQVVGSNTLHRW